MCVGEVSLNCTAKYCCNSSKMDKVYVIICKYRHFQLYYSQQCWAAPRKTPSFVAMNNNGHISLLMVPIIACIVFVV